MERAYREDELLDSMVVDSEGYVYGKVGKITIKENEVSLLVYETRPDQKTVVNIESVKEELLKRVRLTLGAKLQKLPPSEVLSQNIQRELGLKPEEPLTDEVFVKYAERLGVNVPYEKVIEERREPKGTVSLRDVKAIGISTIGTQEVSGATKVVLLREPREAKFRKLPIQNTVPYRTTEMLKDKLVIDTTGTAVGGVDAVVIFLNAPGIRIYALKPTDSVSLSMLFRYLEKTGRPDVIETIAKHFGAEGDYHIYRVTRNDLEDFMKKTHLNLKIPEEAFLDRSVKQLVMDIPWDMVQKIGDVVLLKEPASDIRSQGY